MIGPNKLVLSPAAMIEALDYYLNQQVIKADITVTGVDYAASGVGSGYTVRFVPTIDEEDDDE